MIGLIFCGDLKYCPYINRYTERLDIMKVEYKIYYWNRSGFEYEDCSRHEAYNTSSNLNSGKIGKAIDFIRYRKWLVSKLNKDRPEKLIILSTLTGILLGKYLTANNCNYIFDIRDYSYEHIKLFSSIEKKIIDNSNFTAISSSGFKAFLPEHEYVIAHNFNKKEIDIDYSFSKKSLPLDFVWNGVVRYFDYQVLYLDKLKNDSRFRIVFHGDGPELQKYIDYCMENKYENIIFTGSYKNEDKASILTNAAILNNAYGYVENAGNKLKYAVSNRFYDGMIYHIPQIVEPVGFKSEWAENSKIGKPMTPSETFADDLFEYYNSINDEEFDNACNEVLQSVVKEDEKYISAIDAFINE